MSSCRAVVSVIKQCERCKAEFSCGLSCCWCGEVPRSPQLTERLRERFADCLCPGCLQAVADESRSSPAPLVVAP